MNPPASASNSVGHDLIVIGTSLGGLDVLRRLVGALPDDLPAAVCVVQHVSARSPGTLGEILDRSGPLPAACARDGDALRRGRIYVAPPDHHLLVFEGEVRLTHGPRENRSRPAIDPLFRSAAVAYRSRVIGVILSGLQDDGAVGLSAVQRCGGLAVVQDPNDAAYAEMPMSALRAVEGAHTVAVTEMGALLDRLTREPAGVAPPIPEDLLIEAKLTEGTVDEADSLDRIGERTAVTCPDCGGTIWEIGSKRPRRYRCHIGHAFSEEALLAGQAEGVEDALLVALRTMEDRVRMLRRMGDDGRGSKPDGMSGEYRARAEELEGHVETVRSLLLGMRTA